MKQTQTHYQPTCSCGYYGAAHTDQFVANKALERHRKAVIGTKPSRFGHHMEVERIVTAR